MHRIPKKFIYFWRKILYISNIKRNENEKDYSLAVIDTSLIAYRQQAAHEAVAAVYGADYAK